MVLLATPARSSLKVSRSVWSLVRNLNTPITTKDINASAHSAQASQEAARTLGPPFPRPCCLAPGVTTPIYRKIVSGASAQGLRPRGFGATRCLYG